MVCHQATSQQPVPDLAHGPVFKPRSNRGFEYDPQAHHGGAFGGIQTPRRERRSIFLGGVLGRTGQHESQHAQAGLPLKVRERRDSYTAGLQYVQ